MLHGIDVETDEGESSKQGPERTRVEKWGTGERVRRGGEMANEPAPVIHGSWKELPERSLRN